jgi:hypothetical protein
MGYTFPAGSHKRKPTPLHDEIKRGPALTIWALLLAATLKGKLT